MTSTLILRGIEWTKVLFQINRVNVVREKIRFHTSSERRNLRVPSYRLNDFSDPSHYTAEQCEDLILNHIIEKSNKVCEIK